MRLIELDMSVRAYNCLTRAGIDTVEELTKKTEQDLNRVRNLGRKNVEEVKDLLATMGLSLAEST